MTNKFISMIDGKRIGLVTDSSPRFHRSDSLSVVSRQSVLSILLLCLTLFVGVGNAWGALTEAYSYTFTAKQFSDNSTAKTLGTITWTPSTSWKSGSGYWGYDSNGTKGQQWGSKDNGLNTLTLTAGSSFSNIKKITINASIASSGSCKLSVKVGSTPIGSEETLTTTATDYDFESATGLTGAVQIKLYNNSVKKAQYIKSITIYTEEAPAYTITASSNNNSWGTVSGTSTITASPKAGYRVSTNSPYSVSPANSATVSQNGNTFTVTPSANTTVTINFEAIPTHKISFNTGGLTTIGDATGIQEGAVYNITQTPAASLTENCEYGTFVGWTTASSIADASVKPALVSSVTMSTSDVTLYAVYSKTVGGGGNNGSIELTTETENFPATYGTANTFTEYTLEGKKFKIQQGYVNGTKLQWRASGNSSGTGIIYNTEVFPAKITSVVLVYDNSDNNKNFTLNVSNTENPTSGTAITPSSEGNTYTFDCSEENADYFVLANGSGAGYLTSITINYGSSGTTTYSLDANCCTSLGSINGSISLIQSGNDLVASEWNATTGSNETGYLVKLYNSTKSAVIASGNTEGTAKTYTFTNPGAGTYWVSVTPTFSGDGNFCEAGEETFSASSITLTGKVVVTFKLNDGTVDGGVEKTQEVTANEATPLTSIATLGYIAPSCKQFGGWAASQEDANAEIPVVAKADGASITATEATNLWAIWNTKTISVTDGTIAASVASHSYSEVACDGTLTITCAAAEAYKGDPTVTATGTHGAITVVSPTQVTIANVQSDIAVSIKYETPKLQYAITWMVEGVAYTPHQEEEDGKVNGDALVYEGNTIAVLPTAPAGLACANTFMGWSRKNYNTVPKGTDAEGYNDLFTTGAGAGEISKAETFYAVFAKSGTQSVAGYSLSNTAPVDGDQVIIARLVSGTYYALKSDVSTGALSLSNGIVSDPADEVIWDIEEATSGVYVRPKGETTGLHMNSSALKVAAENTNGDIKFSANGNGSFKGTRADDARWIVTSGETGLSCSSTEANAADLYIFKYSAGGTTYSNYVTKCAAVAVPTFSVEAGTYDAAQTVELSCETEGADIYYTTDGETTPTSASTPYEGAITVNQSMTIKAVAILNSVASEVNSAAYVLKVKTPTINADKTEFFDKATVTLACDDANAKIYYTIGEAAEAEYAEPFEVNATATVTAVAKRTGWTDSENASQDFTRLEVLDVAGARDAIDQVTSGQNTEAKYVRGIISSNPTFDSKYNSLTYNISADGESTSDQLKVYSGKSYGGANFSSADDLLMGDEVVVYGTMKLYQSTTYQFNYDNQLVERKQRVMSIALSGEYMTECNEGATFSHEGMIVTATYNYGDDAVVTANATWSTPDLSTEGAKTVTVSYTFDGKTVTKDYTITVNHVCASEITITKDEEANGTFALSATGAVCGDGDGAEVEVTDIAPAEGYRFKTITATAGDVDNDLKKVTGIKANATIGVEFEQIPTHQVTWNVNGDETTKTTVQEGSKPVFPATPVSCDDAVDGSKTFIGWATAAWKGKKPLSEVSATIYTNASEMPAVNAAVTYYAVFAKGDPKHTVELTYEDFGLTASYEEKSITKGGFGFTVDKGYKSNNNEIQMNTGSGKGAGQLYNTSAIEGLKSVKVNVGQGNKTYTITTGTSQNPTDNSQQSAATGTFNALSGDTYFQLQVSGASYFSSIEVTYEEPGFEYEDYMTSCCTKLDALNLTKAMAQHTATLTWDAIDGVTAWSVSGNVKGGDAIAAANIGAITEINEGAQKQCVISNLTTNTTYEFQVSATSFGEDYCTDVNAWSIEGTTDAAFVITAVASNEGSYGTVSVEGEVITATVADYCRYATPAYTVTSGTATVVQGTGENVNKFTVTPESDCTVQINFEQIPITPGAYDIVPNTTFWGCEEINKNNAANHEINFTSSQDNITVTIDNGTKSNAYINASQTRVYDGYTMVFSVPTGYLIKAITFSVDNSTWSQPSVDVGDMTASKTWEGKNNSVTFSFDGTCRITNINVDFVAETKQAVTFAAPTGGTLTIKDGDDAIASGDEVAEDKVLDVTLTPADAYHGGTVKVVKTGVEPEIDVTATDYSEGQITIKDYAITVSASFVPDAAISVAVADGQSSWGSVKLYDGDLNEVDNGTTFKPEANMMIVATPSNPEVYEFVSWAMSEGSDITLSDADALNNSPVLTAGEVSTTFTATFRVKAEPFMTVDPASLAFGAIAVSISKEMTFALTGENMKADASLAITGDNAAMFAVAPSVAKVGTDISADVTVTYTPNALGNHSATLRITSTDANTIEIPLSGSAATAYTATWYVNGQAASTVTDIAGTALTFPDDPTPSGDCKNLTFVGWLNEELDEAQDDEPENLIKVTSGRTMPASNVNYYAVFAEGEDVDNRAEYSYTITTSDFPGNGYAANNNEKTKTATCISDPSKTVEVKWTSNQVDDQSSKIQGQKNTAYIYNAASWGKIKSITLNENDGFSYVIGAEAEPLETAEGGFFKISAGSSTSTATTMEIVFEQGDITTNYSNYVTTCVLCNKVTLAKAGEDANNTFALQVNSTDVSSVKTCSGDVEVNIVANPATGNSASFAISELEGVSISGNVITILQDADGALTVTATFSPINYNVTMVQTGGANAELSADQENKHYGDEITVTAKAKDGYGFLGWTASPEVEFADASALSTTFSMPNSDVTVTANYAQIATCVISFMVNGEAVATEDAQQTDPYNLTGVTHPTVPGFTWVGWSETEYEEEVEVAPTTINSFTPAAGEATKVLYGIYRREDAGDPNIGKYIKATNVAAGDYLIVCEDQNVVFDGSLGTLDAVGNSQSVTISNGIVNLANADNYKFTIAEISGGYSIRSASGKYIGRTENSNGLDEHATTVYTNIITLDNGAFEITSSSGPKLQYYSNGNQSRFRYFKTSQKAIQLYKKNTGVTYYTSSPVEKVIITFNNNGGEGGCARATINKGTELQICAEAPAKYHQDFTGWNAKLEGDGAAYEAGQTYTFDADITLYAQWTDATARPVTYNANGAEGDAPTIADQYAGDNFDVADQGALEKSGYIFQGWRYNNKLYKAGVSFTMPDVEEVEFKAQWKKQTIPTDKMSLVTEVTSLADGMQIAFGCSCGENNFAMAGEISSKYFQSMSNANIKLNNNIATYTNDVLVMTLEQVEDGWKIKKDENNYLAHSAADVNWGTKDAATIWAISFSNGNVIIANENRKIMFNSSTPRFKAYTNETPIQLFGKAVVVSENASISDLGYVEGEAIVASGANVTLTINEPTNAKSVTAQNGATVVIDEPTTAQEVVVENGSKIVANEATTTPTVYFATTMGVTDNNGDFHGVASELGEINNITLAQGGEIIYDLTLGVDMSTPEGAAKAANQWHAFSLPFRVDALTGIYNAATGDKLTNEVDYAIMDYDGEIRANGQYGWKKFRGILEPGVFYLMTVNGDIQTFRFKATQTGAMSQSNSMNAQAYTGTSTNESDQGWNGFGNPRWIEGTFAHDVQYLDPYTYEYVTISQNETVPVGLPFFYKASSSGPVAMGDITSSAPARNKANEIKKVAVRFGNDESKDKLYISASEDALNTYEQDKDLVKMFMSQTPKVARISANAYGMKLCVVDAPLANNQAEYSLTLYAPNAGEYMISAQEMEDADLYLTQNGSIIWNLSMSEYVADFAKGNNEGYGLLLIKKAPGIATGVDEISGEKAGVQKIVIEDKVFILRGGKMYDVTGKAVK